MFPAPTLQSPRLILRLLQTTDLPGFFAYRSDAHTNRYQGWIPRTMADAEEFVNYRIATTINRPDTWFQFAIVLHHNQRLIGDLGVYFHPQPAEHCTLGYTLDKNYQKLGYATEALQCVIRYLFVKLNKNRLFAKIDPDNAASLKLIRKLGFVYSHTEHSEAGQNYPAYDDMVFFLDVESVAAQQILADD